MAEDAVLPGGDPGAAPARLPMPLTKAAAFSCGNTERLRGMGWNSGLLPAPLSCK
jgi:hypothetical protein